MSSLIVKCENPNCGKCYPYQLIICPMCGTPLPRPSEEALRKSQEAIQQQSAPVQANPTLQTAYPNYQQQQQFMYGQQQVQVNQESNNQMQQQQGYEIPPVQSPQPQVQVPPVPDYRENTMTYGYVNPTMQQEYQSEYQSQIANGNQLPPITNLPMAVPQQEKKKKEGFFAKQKRLKEERKQAQASENPFVPDNLTTSIPVEKEHYSPTAIDGEEEGASPRIIATKIFCFAFMIVVMILVALYFLG